MTRILVSFILIFICHFQTITSQECYEELEKFQLRFTINNYQLDERYRSPMFPLDADSETRWNIDVIPRKLSNSKYIAGQICLRQKKSSQEFVKFTMSLLKVDFDILHNYSTPVESDVIFLPTSRNTDCYTFQEFFNVNEKDLYLAYDGTLEVFGNVLRLRKLAKCLNDDTENSGSGNITLGTNLTVTATHCKVYLEYRACQPVTSFTGGMLPLKTAKENNRRQQKMIKDVEDKMKGLQDQNDQLVSENKQLKNDLESGKSLRMMEMSKECEGLIDWNHENVHVAKTFVLEGNSGEAEKKSSVWWTCENGLRGRKGRRRPKFAATKRLMKSQIQRLSGVSSVRSKQC